MLQVKYLNIIYAMKNTVWDYKDMYYDTESSYQRSQIKNQLTSVIFEFVKEKIYLFLIAISVELYFAYLTTICIPLSFIIANSERRRLIYELVPKKLRVLFETLFCNNSSKVAQISMIELRSGKL